ncbi:conserved hypothetical protein [Microsporum canis CBS 113480]|uniref:Uncharacterized protein n=1 Tax=Arthroderma otae (strain ATCC MYA-4605 / CBS 113480) TaxID=554155 RepID=C5FBL3_ARTOC|nr:conserved hypothetical protein [Microsporum canis CBS 113480]EEQ27197.1 conserved hypothetical protein [Microsporum canis CBS 113480]
MAFYTFDMILGGACTTFAVIAIFLHLLNHATHLSVPREQIKIMRAALLVPSYSVCSFLCICFPKAAVYLLPWLDAFQANCLATYFLLLCEYVAPDDPGRDLFFSTIELKDKRAQKKMMNGAKWFRQRWICIFQYVPVSFLVAITTVVTERFGVFCQYKIQPAFAKLWLTVINNISPAVAFTSVVLVALSMKPHMPQHRLIAKLLAVKLVVGLGFVQRIIFWILESTPALNPTDKLTYADLNIGIPALLSCLEMVPISLLVIWAYPVGPYKYGLSGEGCEREPEAHPPRSYQGGFLGVRAFISTASPLETIKGVVFAFKLLVKRGP